MTDLRTAAQQALEALEIGYDSAQAEAHQFHAAMAGYRPQRHAQMDADVQKIAAAITALRAALAEHDKKIVWVEERKAHWAEQLQLARETQERERQQREEEAALAEPVQEPVRTAEPVQEPFGYLWPTGRHPEFRFTQQKRDGVDGMPLYAASPQRKPLTEEEIKRLVSNDMVQFARAIERAHGIGEQQ